MVSFFLIPLVTGTLLAIYSIYASQDGILLVLVLSITSLILLDLIIMLPYSELCNIFFGVVTCSLLFLATSHLELLTYYDVDWAGYSTTMKSTIGY